MADTWEALEQACGQCRNCALAETRLHVVFGDGARDAEILLVGEGPGQREDEQGIPFVGPAGLLLDDMLEIIGLDRTKVYVANIVKCRPPRNRDPLNVEQDALHRLAPAADGAAAAQADCLSGPDRRQGHHQGGLQDHRRAWEVVPAGRRPDDGYLPSLRAAAGCGEAAGDLWWT